MIYFDAVNELRNEVKINPLIELVPVVRSYSENGWSNPKKIVNRVIQNIKENESGRISYETILNWIMEYFEDEKYIVNNRTLAKSMWNTLNWICDEKLNVSLNETADNPNEVCSTIFQYLNEEKEFENLIVDIEKIVKYGNFTYEKDIDKICFIVDRDWQSFSCEQYDYVVSQCEQKNYGLFITNPCFEFWLLLHFSDVTQLDKEKLLLNQSVTSKYVYTEYELRKHIKGFKKSKYDASAFVRNIDTAIKNEKNFCEDLKTLKNCVGSNIGILINEMRK